MPWALSLGVELDSTTVMCDRGGEFAELSPFVKHLVKTSAYSPQANGAVERKHKDLAVYCSLYNREPPEVAELLSKIQVAHVKKTTPEAGSLFLRYVKKIQAKDKDRWIGPSLTLRKIGRRMVEALNMDTKKKAVVHLNDLKELKRPSLIGISVRNAVDDLLDREDELADLRDRIVREMEDGQRLKKTDVGGTFEIFI